MTVNSYTLNQLYANGIIDYVPDLGQAGMFGSMQNPYMNMAMQGAGFQNYGSGADSFSYSTPHNANYNQKIGTNSSSLKSALGFAGIGSGAGTQNNLSGQTEIGGQSNVGFANSFGGFTDVSNNMKSVASKISGLPDWVKGVGSLLIIGLMFKGLKGKKPKKQGFFARLFGKKQPEKQGFFARLFGKKPQEPPKKEGFFSRINIFKSKNK